MTFINRNNQALIENTNIPKFYSSYTQPAWIVNDKKTKKKIYPDCFYKGERLCVTNKIKKIIKFG